MLLKKKKVSAFESTSDDEVIRMILEEGKKELLEVLYERYAGKVFYKCLHIVKNEETAKDLAHDIMVKIFVNLVKFKGNSKFSLWVHSIAYNYCMDYLRKKKRIHFQDYSAAAYEQISTDEIELENKILAELKLSQLESLLEQLKPEEKLILFMRYQDGMSVKQIAQTLNLGESAVKMRLKRSRDHLATLFNDQYEN